MQDLPHESREPVRDRPDRLLVAETHHETAIDDFKEAAFRLHRRIRGLIEEPPHLPIALGRSMAVIDAGALVMTTNYDDLLCKALRLPPVTWEDPEAILVPSIRSE